MKKELIQRILSILVMVAVLIYTFYNYYSGKFGLFYFVIAVTMLGYPLICMICRVIVDLRDW